MKKYMSSAQLKALARGQLIRHYGTTIWAFLLVVIINLLVNSIFSGLLDTTTLPGTILYYIISFLVSVILGLFTVGENFLYLKLATGQPIAVSDIWYGFQNNRDTSLKLLAIYNLLLYAFMIPYLLLSEKLVNPSSLTISNEYFLPFCIAFVIGNILSIYVNLLFSQIFYLILDFPGYSAKQIMNYGFRLMKGSKGRLFYMEISFLPLMLLACLSLGIGLLWIYPYMSASHANFFLDLMKKESVA